MKIFVSVISLALAVGAGTAQAEIEASGFVNMCSSNGDTVAVCTCAASELLERIGSEKFVDMNAVAGEMFQLQEAGQTSSDAYLNLRTQMGALTSLDGTPAIHYFHSIDACL